MVTARQHALASIRETLSGMDVQSPAWETLAHAEYMIIQSMNDTRENASSLYHHLSEGHEMMESVDKAVKDTASRAMERMYWNNGGKWTEVYRRLMECYTNRQIVHAVTGYSF